jgi:hypothetical protein
MKFFLLELQPYLKFFHLVRVLMSCMEEKSLGFKEYNVQLNIQE